MPDDETREEPEVEGHGFPPGPEAAEGFPPAAEARDDDSDDVEAHLLAAEGFPPAAEGFPPAAE